jgi:hypothetical protein
VPRNVDAEAVLDTHRIGFIGLLRRRGWALKLYSPLAHCRGDAGKLIATADRVFAAHIADPGAIPAAAGFAYFEPPAPEFAMPGRLSAYWWEAGELHRRVLCLPLNGSPPASAPDAAERIGGPLELALILREIAAPERTGGARPSSRDDPDPKEICE